jgi:uncharacterized protein involved in exopolysaccharide biosynthesis/Mrp family chromosome partitioning ATPase
LNSVLKSHALRVFVTALVGAGLAYAYYSQSPRIYQGRAQLIVADAKPILTTDETVNSALAAAYVQDVMTEQQTLQSEGLFKRAVARVAHQRDPKKYPDVDSQDTLRRAYMDLKGFRMFPMYNVEGRKGTRILIVNVKAYDSKLAAEVANAVVQEYNRLRQDTSRRSLEEGEKVLVGQVNELDRKLKAADAALQRFKMANGITDISVQQASLAGTQATIQTNLGQAQAELSAAQRERESVNRQLSAQPKMRNTQLTDMRNPAVSDLEQELRRLELTRSELTRTYTDTSIRVQQHDEKIRNVQERLLEAKKTAWVDSGRTTEVDPVYLQLEQSRARADANISMFSGRIARYRQLLQDADSQIRAMPRKEMQLVQLERDRAVLAQKYERTRASLEDMRGRNTELLKAGRLMFDVVENKSPVAPDRNRLLLMGTLGGACLGLLYSFVRESLRSNVRSSTELEELLELPVTATVPALSGRQVQARLQALSEPGFKPIESFRFMAASTVGTFDGKPRTVLFTSVGGSVGCSSAAAQYAVAVGAMGLKVALVDADLHHTTVTRAFKLERCPGLRDILNRSLLPSKDSDARLLQATPHKNLSVLAAGSVEGLGLTDVPGGEISGVLESLAEAVDVVVIDSPPCDVLADASRLVPHASEVCLVVSARDSSIRLVSKAKDLLKRAGAKDIQVVMTHTLEEEPFARRNYYVK